MSDILCLDTEPDTLAALWSARHKVVAAAFGYGNGARNLSDAPHDFDLLVCDLRRLACFDLSRWGPTAEMTTTSVPFCHTVR